MSAALGWLALRGVVAFLACAAVLAVGAESAAASARLHAFRSCSNLLTYAKHNGLRVIRETEVDVSSLSAPRRLSTASVGPHSYTEAEYDHHAFLWWAPERLAVVPAIQYSANFSDVTFGGMVAYRISASGALTEVARMGAPGRDLGASYSRAIVVGSHLLLISGDSVFTTPLAAPGPGQATDIP